MAGAVLPASFQAPTGNQGAKDSCCSCLFFPSTGSPRKEGLSITGKEASPKWATH